MRSCGEKLAEETRPIIPLTSLRFFILFLSLRDPYVFSAINVYVPKAFRNYRFAVVRRPFAVHPVTTLVFLSLILIALTRFFYFPTCVKRNLIPSYSRNAIECTKLAEREIVRKSEISNEFILISVFKTVKWYVYYT